MDFLRFAVTSANVMYDITHHTYFPDLAFLKEFYKNPQIDLILAFKT
jgi:hypothetical protein